MNLCLGLLPTFHSDSWTVNINCQTNVRNFRVVQRDSGQRDLTNQAHRTNTNWSENKMHSDERKVGAQTWRMTWSSRMIRAFIEFNFARGSRYTTLFQSHQRVKPMLVVGLGECGGHERVWLRDCERSQGRTFLADLQTVPPPLPPARRLGPTHGAPFSRN